MQSRFRSDPRLTARMGITLFLFARLLYVAFIAALIVLLKSWVLVVVMAAALLGAQYWFSDRVALFAMGAGRGAGGGSAAARGRRPAVCHRRYAEARGRRVGDGHAERVRHGAQSRSCRGLCDTGLLRRLEPDELEGVLAHELSHVAHKDVAVITVASFLGVIAGLIVRFAFYSQLFGGARRDQNTAAVFAAVMAVSVAVYTISFLLIRALSRYRELAADRAAALLTGRPSALASALPRSPATSRGSRPRTCGRHRPSRSSTSRRRSAGSPVSRGSSPPTRAWSSGSTNWGGSPLSWGRPRLPEGCERMGLLDILFGRTKPVAPDLDQLFGLPSAAVTLEAAAGFRPPAAGRCASPRSRAPPSTRRAGRSGAARRGREREGGRCG